MVGVATFRIHVLLIILGCTACAGGGGVVRLYEGKERLRTDVALLEAWEETDAMGRGNVNIRLVAVDGRVGPDGPKLGFSSSADGRFSVELLPGIHALALGYASARQGPGVVYFAHSQSDRSITFKARAGHTYCLAAGRERDSWYPILLDYTSRTVLYPEAFPIELFPAGAPGSWR